MLKRLIIVMVGLSWLAAAITASHAQDNKNKVFKLEVAGSEVEMIGAALGKLPYGEVATLMQKLQTQIFNQNQQEQTKPVDAPTPAPKE